MIVIAALAWVLASVCFGIVLSRWFRYLRDAG